MGTSNTFKPAIKQLTVIHTAMLLAQIIFAGTVYAVSNQMKPVVDEQLFKVLQSVAVILALGGGAAAFMLFKKKMQELQQNTSSIDEKLEQYKAASIPKFALLEAPSLFCCVGYLLTQNISFLILCMVLIFVFAGQKPTISLITHHMNVGRDELFE